MNDETINLSPEDEAKHVKLGNLASDFLNTEAYKEVMAGLINSTVQVFLNTTVGEADKREHAFYFNRAIQDIDATLKQWVAIRDQILERAETESEEQTP